jgi:2-polyprenyl-6-methoxyphenol hydroxylase-like FAD-dependent oxidoreductase
MSLSVVIVGAGIAGLSAAISLRRAGHRVTIFEQSGFAVELGAAIHLPPNASRVLQNWGFNRTNAGVLDVQRVFYRFLGGDIRVYLLIRKPRKQFLRDLRMTLKDYMVHLGGYVTVSICIMSLKEWQLKKMQQFLPLQSSFAAKLWILYK